MKANLIKLGFPFFIATTIMIVVGLTLGYYYEDNQVVIVNLLYYAKPNEMFSSVWMNDFDFLMLPLLATLCQKITAFPVYAVWQLLQPFVWLTAFFYFLLTELKVAPLWVKCLAIIAVVAMGLDSLVSQICFRNSIFLAGAALLFTRQRLLRKEKIGIWPAVLFVYSLIPRSHPAAIVLLLFMGHEILAGMGFKRVIKAHVPHLFACIIVIGSYQLYGMLATKNTGKILEAEYEYAWFEKGAYKPLSDMKTAKDSLKYWAVQQWFLSDSAELNLAFIDRVVDRSDHYRGFLSLHIYQAAYSELKNQVQSKWHLLVFPLLLLLVGFYNKSIKRLTLLALLVYLGVLLLLLFLLVDQLKDRFFIPFTAIVSLIVMVDILSAYKSKEIGASKYLLATAFLLLVVGQVRLASRVSADFKEADKAAETDLMAQIEYCRKNPVLCTIDVPLPSIRNVLYRSPENIYNNLAWLEAGYMIYYPYLEARIQNVAGFSALRFTEFLSAADSNKNLRIIASPFRLNVLKTYSMGMCNRDLLFTIDTTQPKWSLPYKAYQMHITEIDTVKKEMPELIFLPVRTTQDFVIKR